MLNKMNRKIQMKIIRDKKKLNISKKINIAVMFVDSVKIFKDYSIHFFGSTTRLMLRLGQEE
jgi:hypothetical protein